MTRIMILLAILAASCGPQTETPVATPRASGNSQSVIGRDDSLAASTAYCAVQKIFDSSCVKCHSANGGQKPWLEKESAQSSLVNKMGHHGIYLLKQNAAKESELFIRITSNDPHLHMPRGEPSLGSADIETIRSWIDAGASFACKN